MFRSCVCSVVHSRTRQRPPCIQHQREKTTFKPLSFAAGRAEGRLQHAYPEFPEQGRCWHAGALESRRLWRSGSTASALAGRTVTTRSASMAWLRCTAGGALGISTNARSRCLQRLKDPGTTLNHTAFPPLLSFQGFMVIRGICASSCLVCCWHEDNVRSLWSCGFLHVL